MKRQSPTTPKWKPGNNTLNSRKLKTIQAELSLHMREHLRNISSCWICGILTFASWLENGMFCTDDRNIGLEIRRTWFSQYINEL